MSLAPHEYQEERDLYLPTFAIIPYQIRIDKKICPAAQIYYGELMALAHTTGIVWATDEKLAKMKSVSVSTIEKWHKEFEKHGYIVRRNKRYSYQKDGDKHLYWANRKEIILLLAPQIQNQDSKKDCETVKSYGVAQETSDPVKFYGSLKQEGSKGKQQPEPSAVVVFSCLDDLKITSTKKQQLSEQFTEENCKLLVKRVKAWKEKKNDIHGVNTILKNWDGWSDDLSKEDIKHINEKFLDSTPFRDGFEVSKHRVTIGNRECGRYIEFVSGMFVGEFLTRDKNFIQKLKEFAKDRLKIWLE